MKKFLLAITLLLLALPAHARSTVTLASLRGTVGVQMEEYVKDVIAGAEASASSLIVFELDTPGGLVEAMRGIVQAILSSQVPAAVWVPPGGRAASAGAFIVQAAHIAAMSPGTNIGAAHPVTAGGKDIDGDTMTSKIMNDLKAQMRSVVQLRGRNQEITEKMIDESISLTATEALKARAIDLIAGDVNTLIKAVRGRRGISLDDEVMIARVGMSFGERVIQFVSSPEIAYMLLSGGIMAIFFEVITPGGFILGTTGGVMLLLGAIGLKMLPFNWAGIVLIVAGIILMAIDLYAGTGGLLSLLGLPVFCLGGVFLFRAPGGELLQISMTFIVGIAVSLGICFGLAAYLVVKGLRRKVTTGKSGMIGERAEILTNVSPDIAGQVKCRGEIWSARTQEGRLLQGTYGVVKSLDGMTLIISRE